MNFIFFKYINLIYLIIKFKLNTMIEFNYSRVLVQKNYK